MQWSYHLRSTILATTSKLKMAFEIGVFRLIREAIYFCSTITATTSKFCWELQIDVSIIYWFYKKWSSESIFGPGFEEIINDYKLYCLSIIRKLMFTLAWQANYKSCGNLTYIIQFVQHFCAKFLLRNFDRPPSFYFIAKNVSQCKK